MTRVVVGIVTYNSAAHWPACWHALQAQTPRTPKMASLQIEIRIYDNASTDSTVADIRRLAPDLALTLSSINCGYGAAHNALIAEANLQAGDFYLALNPDAVPEPAYIARLIEVLQHARQAGWATGALYRPDGRLYSLGHALQRDGYAINIGYGLPADAVEIKQTAPFEIFGAPGAAVLIKAELLSDLGTAFDETFFVYNEDVDFDWRARRHGWRCWCVPDAKAVHEGSHANEEGQARSVVNRWLMILKNASTYDLLLYHLPRWMAHIVIRLCVTPHWGLWMLRRFFRLAPIAWQVRQADPPPFIDHEMAQWFRAKEHATHQPQSYWQRGRALRDRGLKIEE
jgi:N-acetylglucosaminyl-diphospho-decaprenol L-rhamnosyltransferase